MFENLRKSLILQNCERSELPKVHKNGQSAIKQCYQTGQFQKAKKLVRNAKTEF